MYSTYHSLSVYFIASGFCWYFSNFSNYICLKFLKLLFSQISHFSQISQITLFSYLVCNLFSLHLWLPSHPVQCPLLVFGCPATAFFQRGNFCLVRCASIFWLIQTEARLTVDERAALKLWKVLLGIWETWNFVFVFDTFSWEHGKTCSKYRYKRE